MKEGQVGKKPYFCEKERVTASAWRKESEHHAEGRLVPRKGEGGSKQREPSLGKWEKANGREVSSKPAECGFHSLSLAKLKMRKEVGRRRDRS